MGITDFERSYGELLAAFGDLCVARARGAPLDPAAGSTRALARRYRARRRAFATNMPQRLDATRLVGEDRRAADTIRGTLVWMDAIDPTLGLLRDRAPPPPGPAAE